jgi:hypothetical protein
LPRLIIFQISDISLFVQGRKDSVVVNNVHVQFVRLKGVALVWIINEALLNFLWAKVE